MLLLHSLARNRLMVIDFPSSVRSISKHPMCGSNAGSIVSDFYNTVWTSNGAKLAVCNVKEKPLGQFTG